MIAEPDLDGQPGWEPLPRFDRHSGESYVSGEPTGKRLRVRYFRRPEDGALAGRSWSITRRLRTLLL